MKPKEKLPLAVYAFPRGVLYIFHLLFFHAYVSMHFFLYLVDHFSVTLIL